MIILTVKELLRIDGLQSTCSGAFSLALCSVLFEALQMQYCSYTVLCHLVTTIKFQCECDEARKISASVSVEVTFHMN